MRILKIAIVILLLLPFSSKAQTQKGNISVGASSNLSFSTTSIESDLNNVSTKSNVFNLGVSGGYFVIDDLELGLSGSYSYSKNDGSNPVKTYLLAPFVKHYFLEEKLRPFARVSYGLGTVRSSTTVFDGFGVPTNIDVENDIKSFEAGGGIAYFISNFVSIELNLNYVGQKITSQTSPFDSFDQTTNSFVSSIGFFIFL